MLTITVGNKWMIEASHARTLGEMKIESLESGQWVELENASAQNIQANHYQVTITNVPHWIRMTALDGAPLRIDGKETFRTWGSSKSGGTLILDCLVQPG